MAAAACMHFAAYELVRASSTSLFLATWTSAFVPHALCVVPFLSLLLLQLHALWIRRLGPSGALQAATVMCVAVIAACAAASASLTGAVASASAAALYIFREGYITFISSQQFAFVNSVVDAEVLSTVVGPLYGVTSIVSSAAAWSVNIMSGLGISDAAIGLIGAGVLLLSLPLTTRAYALAAGNARIVVERRGGQPSSSSSACLKALQSSPPLLPLFVCTIAMQSLAMLLSVVHLSLLHDTFPNGAERTAVTGRFYAVINGCAGVLQFAGLPFIVKRLPFGVLVLAPALLCAAMTLWLHVGASFNAAAATFLVYKVCEYACYSATKDLIYAPLSFDARYLASQAIDLFAYRLGKGVMSAGVALWGFTVAPLQVAQCTALAMVAAVGWLLAATAVWLSTRQPSGSTHSKKVQ